MEGNQHSEHLSKLYLETVNQPRLWKQLTKRMEKIKSSVGLNQDKTQNTGLNLETRREVVITVGLSTLPRDALLMAKNVSTVKRKTTSLTCVRVVNVPRVAIDPRVNLDSVIRTNMRWKPVALVMTVNGTLMNKNLFAFSSHQTLILYKANRCSV